MTPLNTGPLAPISDDDHHIGPITARHALVEYGDYECPDCAEVQHLGRELVRDLGDDLCYVFRNFPNSAIHPNAQTAAEGAEAADLQAKFWLMHDRLFEHQAELSSTLVRRLATEISLDVHRFDVDLASGVPTRRVDTDRAEGARAGVHATPTFFVNGRAFAGPYESDPLIAALTGNPA